MDSIEIARAMNAHIKTVRSFKGVFASDKLPRRILEKPSCLIVNTDPANKPGTHWVAIYIPPRGPYEYFDSFGLKPQVKNIKNFILKNSKNYTSNSKQLQSIFSMACGNYCCEYLLHRCQGKTMKQFLKKYVNEPTKNDAIILRQFNLHFNKQASKYKKKHV